jgi:hypothetical protein
MRNIEACKTLSKMTRSSLGPHGKLESAIIFIRHEQNGYQPLGEALCHFRRRHNYP